ncbi:MAG: DinB family protein [Anaerolineales bacterium]
MTLRLLLDLDDTLLNSNIEALIPVYFQKLTGHLAGQLPPEQLLTELVRGTRLMYVSTNPLKTLEQVFSEAFYPPLGTTREALAASIEDFYDNVFPALQPLTSPRPEALAFLEWAFPKFDVSVATDPLFPRKAILHRLRWADLDPEHTPFSLISDFETFHFAKISASYYPEFLLRLGWDSEPVLMVGDSLERDIFPAQRAGLPVFWLRPAGEAGTSETESIPQGSYADLRAFLESVDHASLVPNFSSPQALLIALPASLSALHTLTLQAPAPAWTQRPQSGEWALTEILCHLRDVEREVNLPRFQAALKDVNAFIVGQETDSWAEQRAYIEQDGAQAFNDYASARFELLALLKTFTPEQWERKVRHTIFGPTGLRELAGFMLEHDQSHVRQAWSSVPPPLGG